jgi:hypothetical protein
MDKTVAERDDVRGHADVDTPNGGDVMTRKEAFQKFAEFLEYNCGEGGSGACPDDDEYEEMMRALVASGGGHFDEDFAQAFHHWLRKQSEKRGKSYYELEADVIVLTGGYGDQFRRQHAAAARTALECAFFGEYLAKQPRDVQVDALAELWRCAEEHDRRSQQLRGAIAQLEKTMSSEEVARTLQATVDAYRAGEPLKQKDRVTICAHKHLPVKTRIRTMGAALKKNGSQANDHNDAAAQLVSKAEQHRAEPIAEGMAPVQHRETFPLATDMIRYLSARGIIRLVTIRESWKVDEWPEESRAAVENKINELIAEFDSQYPELSGACGPFDTTDILREVADRLATRGAVADPQQLADPQQQTLQVADPQQR